MFMHRKCDKKSCLMPRIPKIERTVIRDMKEFPQKLFTCFQHTLLSFFTAFRLNLLLFLEAYNFEPEAVF